MKPTKSDIILIISTLIAAIVSAVIIFFVYGDGGAYVAVTVDGAEYGRYSLNKSTSVDITTEYGTNTLVIKDGHASIEFSDCKNGICMRHSPISELGESIVCLPHRLIAEVKK